jgi:hypothetical protein
VSVDAEQRERRLVAGPISAVGVLLVVYGWRRHSPLTLLVGAVAIGAGLKLVR